jgi:hypothetical protein
MTTRRPAPSEPKPVDLVGIREAAAIAGRSVDTLRRWRGEHGLRDYRDPSDPSAPSAFSRGELLALLTRIAATQARRAGSDVVDAVLEPTTAVAPMPTRPHLGGGGGVPVLVQVLVDDLRGVLERQRAEIDRLTTELAAERTRAAAAVDARTTADARAAELDRRLARLEALVAHGKAKALEAERRRLQRLGSGG